MLSTAGQLARRVDAPMLGRDDELRALRDAFERVARERSAAARDVVLGPAGIGKSRLARELERRLSPSAATVLRRTLPALRRGHHLLAAGRDRAPGRRRPSRAPAIARAAGGRPARRR